MTDYINPRHEFDADNPSPPRVFESLNFSNGMMFQNSNCDNVDIGHDKENAFLVYDFKGLVSKVCPRPWCMEPFEVIPVDDLTREQFDELMKVIQEVSEYPYD